MRAVSCQAVGHSSLVTVTIKWPCAHVSTSWPGRGGTKRTNVAACTAQGTQRRAPPQSEEAQLSAFAAGDRVTWTGADADVPEGSVGVVEGFNAEGVARVNFGRRTWAFPDEQLKARQLPPSSPPLPPRNSSTSPMLAPEVYESRHNHCNFV